MHAAIFYGPSNIKVSHDVYCDVHDNNYEKGVQLRVKACAVCGYDVRVYRNGHQKVSPPVILGHEICGQTDRDLVVSTSGYEEEKGSTSTTIKSGSRVAVCPIIPCLNCIYCHYKQYNLCLNLKEIGSSVNGGFAEFVRIPEEILKIGGLVLVPNSISDEEAALLEPLACCLNGLYHIGPVVRNNEQNRVAIIGDGPIGLLHLQLIKRLDRAKTMILGRIPQRIQKAKTMGADATVLFANDRSDNGAKENMEEVLDFTDGFGFNVIIVATSNPASLNLAIKIAAKNSRINIFAGMPKSPNVSFSLDPNVLHYHQISITGSFSSTPRMIQQAVRLAANKEIDLSKIISHRYPLQDINEAMLATEKYYGLRVILNKF